MLPKLIALKLRFWETTAPLKCMRIRAAGRRRCSWRCLFLPPLWCYKGANYMVPSKFWSTSRLDASNSPLDLEIPSLIASLSQFLVSLFRIWLNVCSIELLLGVPPIQVDFGNWTAGCIAFGPRPSISTQTWTVRGAKGWKSPACSWSWKLGGWWRYGSEDEGSKKWVLCTQ